MSKPSQTKPAPRRMMHCDPWPAGMAKAPEPGERYWFVNSDSSASPSGWDNDEVDRARLAVGNVYSDTPQGRADCDEAVRIKRAVREVTP